MRLSSTKLIIVGFALLCWNTIVFSQNPQNINLSTNDSGNKLYKAQQQVKFLPGYKYTASSNSMRALIEKHTVYQDLFSGTTFNSSAINTSLEVGTIQGVADVSASGGATYSVMFPLPYGTNNLMPSLGLSYSSQAGNGHLGNGWSLTGLSSISVVPSTFQQDGVNTVVNPNGGNKFAFDGNRLHSVTGTYGTNGATYSTEAETFVKVTSYGSGVNPDWFKVETKNGLILEFGNTSDSKIKNAGTGIVLSWRLNKISDLFGNKIEYTYTNDSNDSRIHRINYSGNDNQGVPTSNLIEFTYTNRNDKNTSYYGGMGLQLEYLLSRIDIYSDNQLFRKFEFNYGMNTISFLKSITESGAGGIQYNPTIFKYGDSNQSFVEVTSANLSSSDVVAQGDYNGDGLTDVVTTFMSGTVQFWRIHKSNGDGTFSEYRTGELPQGTYQFWNSNHQDLKLPGVVSSFDFFGDGNDDLILFSINGSSNNYTINQLLIVDVYEPTSTNPTGYTNVYLTNLVNPGGFIHPEKFLQVGDFDGDGKDDILVLKFNSSSNLSYWGKLIRASSNSKQGGSKVAFDYYTYVVDVNLTDGLQWLGSSSNYMVSPTSFDGSGRRQLMVKYDNTCEIFALNKNSANNNFSDTKIYSGSINRFSKHQGDFNGDGNLDVASIVAGGNMKIFCSTGSTYIEKNLSLVHLYNGDHRTKILISDVNGDGKSDIIMMYNLYEIITPNPLNPSLYYEQAYETGIDIYLSNGDAFLYENKIFTSVVADLNTVLTSGDFNGDGKGELFHIYATYCPPLFCTTMNTRFYQFNPNGKNQYLDKVKNGLGQEIDFDYQYMSKNINYTKTNVNEQFPVNTFQTSIPLVEKVKSSNGVGGITTSSYSYEGAKLHRQGKGFLGFMKTIITNETSGTQVTLENERFPTVIPSSPQLAFMNIPYLLVPKKQEVRLLSNNSLISESVSTNNLISMGVKYKVQIAQSVTNDAVNTRSTTSTMTYDNFGNVTQTISDNGIETTTTTNVIGTFGSWWIPSVVTQVTTNNLRTGETAYQRKMNYTYTTKGKINTEISDQGTSKAISLAYLYDNFGNTIRITKSAANNPTVISKVEYDSKGRFIVKSINPLNQEHTYVRNNRWGTINSETDITGKTMSYTYNEFGRLLTKTNPLGVVTTHSTQWDLMTGGSGNTMPNNTLFKTVTTALQSPTQTVWYDNLGREVKVETEGLSGNPITVKKFLANGSVSSTTSPFFGGNTPIVMNYTYDVYQRPTSSTNGISSSTINYSASNGNTTVSTTTPLGTTSKTTDASGRVVSSEDEGGTLNFQYYSSGNQKNVSMGNNVLVAMEYDVYGRQTKLIDQNAGETTYEYNAYGQLISQTDANTNQYQMVYDLMGRETTKTGPDGITTSTYVTSGNGLNQLKKITAPNGVFTEYFYDTYNRVITEAKSIDGVVYNSSYEYDGIGRQSTFTYPSGFKIRYYYDTKSNLISVKNNAGSMTYYNTPIENSFGQVTQYLMGNGKTTTNYFTELGFLSTTFTSGVQNLQTEFDPATGNLLNRRDNTKNRIEVFSFDDLNRLSGAAVSIIGSQLTYPPQTFAYESNGNISEKSDVGEYEYDVNKINAVTTVSNDGSLIPTQTQEITYTSFDRTESIDEGTFHIDFTYGPEYNRVKSVLKNSGTTVKTKYFVGLYEKEVTPSGTKEIHYIPTPGSEAVYVTDNGVSSYYYIYSDHLGSPVAVTNSSGVVVAEQNFDAWGRRRNKTDWNYNSVAIPSAQFSWLRGYTGHEHLDEFGLINMNNRMYDPILGRMLAVDNFVQNPFSTQGYNRYSYVGNNPLSYTDPSGEIAVAPIIIGAAIGLYTGYKIADSKGYDFSNWQTYGYMIGGGIIGGVSGGISSAIMSAGGVFAATSSIIMGTGISSIGNYLLSGGETNINISFGAASVGSDGFNYLGKRGNSTWQNIGFAFGAMANFSDMLIGFNPVEVDLVTEHDGPVGHIAIVKKGSTTHGTKNDPNTIISVGPNMNDPKSWHWKSGTNDWATYGDLPNDQIWRQTIKVNKRIYKYQSYINNRSANGDLIYSVELSSCVSHSSRALNFSGVFNVGIHPYSLGAQMYLRGIGIRPTLFTNLIR